MKNDLFKTQEQEDVNQKVYRGTREGYDPSTNNRGTCNVFVGDKPLKNIYGWRWEWGFARGNMISNLAESILEDYFGHNNIGFWLIQRFREDHIRLFPLQEWKLAEYVIDAWVDKVEAEMEKNAKITSN